MNISKSFLFQPPTPLKNPSLIYNELGLSNLTVGAGDGENKSKNDEEKRLLRHVDSVIETIMDETRLSEGEGEISKLLKGTSQSTAGIYLFIKNIWRYKNYNCVVIVFIIYFYS